MTTPDLIDPPLETIRFHGLKAGPKLLVFGAVHGNETCGPNEFRRHDGSALYEIVDEETGAPIREPGVPGRALVTNLRRRLIPILRYPVGDRAQWIDPEDSPDRRFLLLGRSEEAARIASISLYYDDVRALLERFRARLGEPRFQMATVREDGRAAPAGTAPNGE